MLEDILIIGVGVIIIALTIIIAVNKNKDFGLPLRILILLIDKRSMEKNIKNRLIVLTIQNSLGNALLRVDKDVLKEDREYLNKCHEILTEVIWPADVIWVRKVDYLKKKEALHSMDFKKIRIFLLEYLRTEYKRKEW